MSSSRRPGRRVPPKGRALRSDPVPPPPTGSEAVTTERSGTRAQNRAAKRAAGGVRPKTAARVRAGSATRGSNMGLVVLAVIAVAIGVAVVILGNPFGSPAASATPGPSATPSATRQLTGCPTAAPGPLAATDKRTVTIKTAKGDIVMELDGALAPVAAANFIALAECGYYDGVVFHRVIPDFVIQAGDGQYGWIGALDRNRVGGGGPGYKFADEPVRGEYTRGTVAMANGGANTNGSQFFIMVKDSTTLPKSYTIFGHVTSGMDVVDQIVAAPRNSKDLPDNPVAIDQVLVSPAPTPTASPASTTSASVPPSGAPSPAPSASTAP